MSVSYTPFYMATDPLAPWRVQKTETAANGAVTITILPDRFREMVATIPYIIGLTTWRTDKVRMEELDEEDARLRQEQAEAAEQEAEDAAEEARDRAEAQHWAEVSERRYGYDKT